MLKHLYCRLAQEMVQSEGMALGSQHYLLQDDACALQLSRSSDPLWGPAQLPLPTPSPLP